jgi:ubiquinone/menaquinone biosynthesis C-methylase UbiE
VQSKEPQPSQGGVLRVLQSKEETRAFYDKISGVYDVLAEHSEGPVRQIGLDKLALAPGERVLEIGYGTGHCLVQLAKAVGPEGKVFGLIFRKECELRREPDCKKNIWSTESSFLAVTPRTFRIPAAAWTQCS